MSDAEAFPPAHDQSIKAVWLRLAEDRIELAKEAEKPARRR
jgi:hypothetical protein